MAGFNINNCLEAYANSCEYLKTHSLQNPKTLPGLYTGTAGMAVSIHAGLQAGLIEPTDENRTCLQQCFEQNADHLNLAAGIAGQGISLLQCDQFLEEDFIREKLQHYVRVLVQQQQKDGSWPLLTKGEKNPAILTTFSHGVPGIVYFLLTCQNRYGNDSTTQAIRRSLHWITSHYTKVKSQWSFSSGLPGIAATFLKAYDTLQTPLYRKTAEKILSRIPSYPILVDFTQAHGLAGLGEVYLAAHQTLKNEKYQRQADWIAGLFYHTFLTEQEIPGYWSMNAIDSKAPDLMTGSSGIIHFLIRHQYTDSMGYPILEK